MEKSILNDIYENYKNEYNHIFEYINPIYHAERFTEENQTVNFCNALKEVFGKENIYTWFEYPWKIHGVTFGSEKNSSCRFDAVVFIKNQDNDKGNLLIIESKCLRSDSKYIAIRNDFCRILGCKINNDNNCDLEQFTDNKTENKKLIDIHILEDKIDNVYAVILADYWYKPRAQKYRDIQKRWNKNFCGEKKDLFDDFKDTITIAINSNLINELDCKPHKISIQNNQTKKEYFLLTLIARINNPKTIYHFIQ